MKVIIKISLLKTLIFLLILSPSLAQETPNDTLSFSRRFEGQKDIADYYRAVFKIKMEAKKDSAKKLSLGPFYTPIFYPGYSLVTGTLLGMSNNVSFYTHYGKGAKLSTIVFDNVYTEYKQSLNLIRSNLWLNHEKLNLLGDWRFFIFPTYTYGLGGKTSLYEAIPVSYSKLRIYEIMMKQVTQNIVVGVGYSLDYHWNISETNPNPTVLTDLDKYGLTKTSVSSGITLNFQYDNRLNSNNATDGLYANVQLRDNLKALGSDGNWQSATFDIRRYIPLSQKSKSVLALWSYNVFTLGGTPPYFDLPTTGSDTYNNSGRGYAEGRFRGLNYMYLEAEYRFPITQNRFLGGVVFANAATISEWASQKFEKINPGYGFGIRIKMNKYANTNLGIDYAFAPNGAGGFSFTLNELF